MHIFDQNIIFLLVILIFIRKMKDPAFQVYFLIIRKNYIYILFKEYINDKKNCYIYKVVLHEFIILF